MSERLIFTPATESDSPFAEYVTKTPDFEVKENIFSKISFVHISGCLSGAKASK